MLVQMQGKRTYIALMRGMLTGFAALELRKHRKSFAGIIGIALGGVALGLAGTLLQFWDLESALGGAFTTAIVATAVFANISKTF